MINITLFTGAIFVCASIVVYCTPESETFTEHLSKGNRIFLIASENGIYSKTPIYSEHFSEAYKEIL